MRAARYAGRLGFTLEPATERAARASAPALDIASARVAGELRRLLEEEDAAAGLRSLGGLGVPWVADPAALAAVDAAHARPGAPDVPRWAARLGASVAPDAADRAALPGWAVATARALRDGMAAARALRDGAPPSEADRTLLALRPPSVLGALAVGGPAVLGWWERDRHRGPAIDGADLVAAGVAPGPAIGRALAAVRAAVIDGTVGGRDEQLALALRLAREQP